MTTAYELTYTQHVHLAHSNTTSEVTAGFVLDKARAEAWTRLPGQAMHEVKLSDDDLWMVEF